VNIAILYHECKKFFIMNRPSKLNQKYNALNICTLSVFYLKKIFYKIPFTLSFQ